MLLVQHPPQLSCQAMKTMRPDGMPCCHTHTPLLAQLRSQLDQAESLSPLYVSTLVLTR